MKINAGIVVFLAGTFCALSQNNNAGIQGVISDQNGNAVVGASITATGAYVAQTPGGPPQSENYSTVSTAGGQFLFSSVNSGSYTLCVSVPGTAYLDPCRWSSGPNVIVSPGQQATANVVLATGALLQVRIADPAQHLANGDGAVLLGLSSPSTFFHPLNPVVSAATAATFQIAFPPNTALTFEISSNKLQLADAKGATLTTATASTQILVTAGQANPTLNFTITGTK